jgi:hypothetical protein
MTNPAGIAVTVAKGQNAGAVAADLSSGMAAALNPKDAAKDPAGTVLTVANVAQDLRGGYAAIKNWLSPPAPPPPTPPPPPQETR